MDETTDYILDQLAGLGELSARRMFGGVGLYCDGLFFALIGDGILYMKVDDSNRADYEAQGSAAFRPYPESTASMQYYDLPIDVLERPEKAVAWGKKAVAVAQRARDAKEARSKKKKAAKKGARKQAKGRREKVTDDSPSIASLKNIGKVSAGWLAGVGLKTRADLERVGAVGAFRAVEASGECASLNLLYALEGALLDVHWTEIPPPLKDELKAAVGR